VVEAIKLACASYPRLALCLQRSATTVTLLRQCGIPAQLVIGATKLPFRAHAWVEINGRTVNEQCDTKIVYTVMERC
jgi:hypothetical protein